MTPELQALTQRLEDIEKQVAHLAALVVEQSDAVRSVAAQSFVVRDSDGRRRAELGMVIPKHATEECPWLGLFDADESIRACICVGGERAIEGPSVELYDAKGKVGVEIEIGDHGPSVRLFNEDGKATIAIATSELGPCVMVSNPNGDQRLIINTSLSGAPQLLMEDAGGDKVLKLAVESDGPHLLFEKDNNVFWSAPSPDDYSNPNAVASGLEGVEVRLDEIESRFDGLEGSRDRSSETGIWLLGSALAIVLSWSRSASILYCIGHGILSWIYVIYFAFTR